MSLTWTRIPGTAIEVRSASFRRLRGPTYIAVIADEAAFGPDERTRVDGNALIKRWESNHDTIAAGRD